MQAVRSFFPQFDDFGLDSVAAPSRRAGRTRFLGERSGQLGHPPFEHRSTHDHLTLVACNGATTRRRRARPPVGVRLIVVHHLHCSSDPDLSVHWEEPMEEGSGKWVRAQFPALLAFPVGVEDETSVVDASEQHHSRGGAPIGRGCGHCHRLGHGLPSCPRNLEPAEQLGHRIGIDGRFVHGPSLLPRRQWVSARSWSLWPESRAATPRTVQSPGPGRPRSLLGPTGWRPGCLRRGR